MTTTELTAEQHNAVLHWLQRRSALQIAQGAYLAALKDRDAAKAAEEEAHAVVRKELNADPGCEDAFVVWDNRVLLRLWPGGGVEIVPVIKSLKDSQIETKADE